MVILYLFLFLFIVNIIFAGVVGIIIYLTRKPHLKHLSTKPKKLSYVKKLFYCDLNSAEYQTLCKIKFNYPLLRHDDGDFLTLIKDTGFNVDLPLYKISLYKSDTLKSIKKELSILRKLEEYGYATNIAINYRQKDFNHQDLLYLVREQSFVKSVVKIHNTDDISLKLLCAINIFNINFVCDTKKLYFDTKNIGYSLDINNYRYNFFDESYYDFCYTSKVNTRDYSVVSRRTFDYNNNFKISRFNFISLSKSKQNISFNINIPFVMQDNKAMYFTYTNTRNTLTVYNIKDNTKITYTSNLPIFNKPLVSKQGISINYKITKNPYLFITECYDQVIPIPDFIKGEELFVGAKQSYKNILPIKVFTSNPVFNKLINSTLPNRIVANLIYKPQSIYRDFMSFVNKQSICHQNTSFLCQDYLNLQQLFVTNKNAVLDYFSLLYIYLGVYFDKTGIAFNPNKKYILSNSTLNFVKDNINYDLSITNTSLDSTIVNIGGVEYSNLKFIKYNQLNNKLVLQF